MVIFLTIFGGLIALGVVAWVLIKTLAAEERESKGEQ